MQFVFVAQGNFERFFNKRQKRLGLEFKAIRRIVTFSSEYGEQLLKTSRGEICLIYEISKLQRQNLVAANWSLSTLIQICRRTFSTAFFHSLGIFCGFGDFQCKKTRTKQNCAAQLHFIFWNSAPPQSSVTMPTMQSMKPKQANKQSVWTKTNSTTVVKSLMRSSISQICYLRNIFDEGCFTQKKYVDGLFIHALTPAQEVEGSDEPKIINKQAWQLTRWLEDGVFDALERQYLKTMTFSVYTQRKGSSRRNLVESYCYTVTYPEAGKVCFFAKFNCTFSLSLVQLCWVKIKITLLGKSFDIFIS